jgi:hypothetical protein
MISKTEAIAKFKEIIGTKGTWGQLAASQFVEHLAIFMSWALRQALWAIERAFQEFFRSTAMNRSSILAHVEDENYIPLKATPATGTCSITNNGAAAVSLDLYQAFLSSTQEDYILNEVVALAAGSTAAVEFKQFEKMILLYAVDEEKAFYEILFDKVLSGTIHSMTVYVDDVEWTLDSKFRNAYSDSKFYDEFYSHTDQVGIRFGNGIFGQVPALDSVVRVELWLTNGDTYLAENQALTIVGEVLDVAGDAVDLAVMSTTALTGGTDMEDTESIRRNLQYWPIYNDQLVWDNDYIYFVKRSVSDIIWMNVWGEKEAEAEAGAASLAFINTIFVSAYQAGGAAIEGTVIDLLEGAVEKLNRKFEWVAPSFVTFTVSVTAKVGKSRNTADVETAITEILATNYDKDSANRKDLVLLREIYALIEGTGYFTGVGEYFEVTAAGDTTADLLKEMVCIDLGTSTFTIGYL